MLRFEVNLSETLLNKVHRKRIFRNFWRLLAAFGLIFIGVFLDLQDGTLGNISAAGLTLIVFACIMYATAYWRQRMVTRNTIKRLGSGPIKYSLTPDVIAGESLLGKTELRWSVFRKIFVADDYTLLSWDGGGHFTLPTQQIPKEALEFMLKIFADNKFVIEDKRSGA